MQLFQAHFQQILNPQHSLIRLADQIDWPRFDAAFADCYREDFGAPAKATRQALQIRSPSELTFSGTTHEATWQIPTTYPWTVKR